MSAYKVIDLKNWKRAIHCEVSEKACSPSMESASNWI